VTNGRLLYLAYFGAAAGGVILAAGTAFLLNKPLRQALRTDGAGRFLARLFPVWLVITVLLGFVSINYLQCRDYNSVINDRQYIIDKSQELVYQMGSLLRIALFFYAIIVIPHLWAAAKSPRSGKKP
jgi:hypothetical protein